MSQSDPGAAAVKVSTVRRLLTLFGPLIGLAFVGLLFSILAPRTFLATDNLLLMPRHAAVIAIAAMGMTLIIISGGIDLSVGSNIALSSVVVALLLAGQSPQFLHWLVPSYTPWSPWAAVFGGIACGLLCGLLNGALITGLRLTPFIVTLGTMGLLRGLAKGMADQQTVFPPPTGLNTLLQRLAPEQAWMLLPPGVWLMLLLVGATAILLRYTRLGRHVYAIGSNEATARLCGIPVATDKLIIYGLGGMMAGIAGVLQFSFLTTGDPTTAPGYELHVIAATVIGGASLAGGQGTAMGSLIGTMIMVVVANGCIQVGLSNWHQEVITGVIIVLAVALDRLRRR